MLSRYFGLFFFLFFALSFADDTYIDPSIVLSYNPATLPTYDGSISVKLLSEDSSILFTNVSGTFDGDVFDLVGYSNDSFTFELNNANLTDLRIELIYNNTQGVVNHGLLSFIININNYQIPANITFNNGDLINSIVVAQNSEVAPISDIIPELPSSIVISNVNISMDKTMINYTFTVALNTEDTPFKSIASFFPVQPEIIITGSSGDFSDAFGGYLGNVSLSDDIIINDFSFNVTSVGVRYNGILIANLDTTDSDFEMNVNGTLNFDQFVIYGKQIGSIESIVNGFAGKVSTMENTIIDAIGKDNKLSGELTSVFTWGDICWNFKVDLSNREQARLDLCEDMDAFSILNSIFPGLPEFNFSSIFVEVFSNGDAMINYFLLPSEYPLIDSLIQLFTLEQVGQAQFKAGLKDGEYNGTTINGVLETQNLFNGVVQSVCSLNILGASPDVICDWKFDLPNIENPLDISFSALLNENGKLSFGNEPFEPQKVKDNFLPSLLNIDLNLEFLIKNVKSEIGFTNGIPSGFLSADIEHETLSICATFNATVPTESIADVQYENLCQNSANYISYISILMFALIVLLF